MFDMGCQPTIVKSMVESADSGLESADYSANSNAVPAKVVVWVWALNFCAHVVLHGMYRGGYRISERGGEGLRNC